MIELEPDPRLVRYFEIASEFTSSLSVAQFFDVGEHYNIVSDVERNILLLRRLYEKGLLGFENNVCDCGFGLGNALFDLYLQSADLDAVFTFTGIEKCAEYVRFYDDRLSDFWSNDLRLVHGDIMDQDLSSYNLVYSYSPFNRKDLLDRYYAKIASEVSIGSVLVEHANRGLGYLDSLANTDGFEMFDVGGQFVFVRS